MFRKLIVGMIAIVLWLTAGYAAADSLILPDGLERIESQAFAGLNNVGTVTFPESVTAIANDAFTGTTFTGRGYENSYAQSWCRERGIPFEVLYTPTSDFEYRVLDDGRLQITAYTGSDSNVVIPSSIDGRTVVSLARELFYNRYSIQTVYLPATIEYFGDDPEDDEMTYVFSYCRALRTITVSGSNPSFCSEGGVLYRHQNGRKTVLYNYPCAKTDAVFTVPDTVTTLDCTSFAACKYLDTLYIPNPETSGKGFTFFDDGQMTVYYRRGGETEATVSAYIAAGRVREADPKYPGFVPYGGLPSAGADELGIVYEVKRNPVGEGVRISWEPAQNAESYKIYRQIRPYSSYRIPFKLYKTTTDTQFLEESCSEDAVYDYMIVSCRGTETASSEYHGYVRMSVMAAPTKKTDGNGGVVVTWDKHPRATYYELYVSRNNTAPTGNTVPTYTTSFFDLSVPVDMLLHGTAGYVYIRPVHKYIEGYIVDIPGAWSNGAYITP